MGGYRLLLENDKPPIDLFYHQMPHSLFCHFENVVVIPHRTCGTNELIIVEENTYSKRIGSTIPGGQIITAWWVESLNWHWLTCHTKQGNRFPGCLSVKRFVVVGGGMLLMNEII